MLSISRIVVMSTLLLAPVLGSASECSPGLKASLLGEAQALEFGTKSTSGIYENNDQGINRLRQLAIFTGAGTGSFAEYFERNNIMTKIYFMENLDGTYRTVHTNDAVDSVVFCDTEYQDESVTWKSSGLPVIDINIVCMDNKAIVSEGVIEYFSSGLEVRGGPWMLGGETAATCAGASEVGTSVYR